MTEDHTSRNNLTSSYHDAQYLEQQSTEYRAIDLIISKTSISKKKKKRKKNHHCPLKLIFLLGNDVSATILQQEQPTVKAHLTEDQRLELLMATELYQWQMVQHTSGTC